MLSVLLPAALTVLLSWGLYPLTIWALTKLRSRPLIGRSPFPSTGCVIVTRDDPNVVSERVDNLLVSEGCEFREILVVLDWKVRQKLEEFQRHLEGRARVILGDAPGGKALGLNAGMRNATSDWIILADSWQRFRPDAAVRLMEGMATGAYDAVSGRVVHAHDDPVMALYWRYENAVRVAQSRLHSVVTTSGAIYLLRRDRWIPLPAGVICDDLFVTFNVLTSGSRVGYVPEAIAEDPRRLGKQQLFQKKVRTLTGLWQFLRWRPEVLLPWRNPIWLHFVFHKLIRLIVPYLVILGLIAIIPRVLQFSAGEGAIPGLLVLVLALVIGILRPGLVRSGWQATIWGGALLLAPLVATYHGVRGDWGVWRHHSGTSLP